jgi:hypothetical protein
MLNITTAGTGTFRLTGITFGWGGGTLTSNGTLRLANTSQFRVDHVHFKQINALAFSHYDAVGSGGVFDHLLLDGYNGSGWRDYGDGAGDVNWANPTALGASNFTYLEDSTFNNAGNDCQNGGRWVIRYNTFNNNGVQTHPTGGAGRARGCRAWELYGNAFQNATNNNFNVFFMSSGTGVVWGNSTPGSTFTNFVTMHSMRRNKNTYAEGVPPNGWGYCGTSFNGAGSNWDQNTNASTGYRCMDQPGQGQGDKLDNDFPNVINHQTGCDSTKPCAWPRQALEPVYEWNDAWTGLGNFWAVYEADAFVRNSEYYLCSTPGSGTCSGFTGTTGVGSGPLSGRPTTCTPGVAYWATDTSTLYKCTAAGNPWIAYYTPYTYPHPLTTQ